MRKSLIWVLFLVVALAITSLSCALFAGEPTPTPLPPPTETPEPPTATPSPEPSPTEEPSPTPSPEPTDTPPPPKATRAADLEGMVFVESETQGVRICHPEGWFYDDTFFIMMSSNPDVDLFSEESQMEDGVVVIVFAGPADELAAEDSPEGLFDELTQEFMAESSEVEIISGPDQTVINDIPAIIVDFEATEAEQTGRGRIAILNNNEQAAVVIAVSPLDQWEEHESTIEDILACVELFEGTGFSFDMPEDENTLDMGTISVGESMAGMLAEGEGHSWTLVAEGGEIVDIIATPLDEEMDLALTILGTDATMFGYYDDGGTDEAEEILGLELDTAGEYVIHVEEFWDAGGSYTLEIVPSEGGGSGAGEGEVDWTAMGELELGQTVESSLDPGERQAWTLTAQAGDVLDITVNPLDAEIDVTFAVIAPNGSPLVAQYDEGFTGEAEELYGLRFEWSGDYTIVVEEFWGEAGSYDLSVEPGTEDSGQGDVLEMGTLAYGEVGTGSLPAGENLYHLWSFEGAAGDFISVVVEPQSADADLMVGLLDPDGNVLLDLIDDTGSDEPEQISDYELPVTGSYTIIVTEYWDEYAEYELTLDLD
jgi:hypothetical protein